jgi:lysine 2,3-aminomutase
MEAWQEQLHNSVRTLKQLRGYINVTVEEERAINELGRRWQIPPHYASLMDPDDPDCPIRRQSVPSLLERVNRYGIPNYLEWKENRLIGEKRPDCIARQYHDRIAFCVTQVCSIYCRHCFRKELTIDDSLSLHFDLEEGFAWIAEHPEIRDVLITGGDPFILSDDKIEYLIRKLREIPHVEMIRFGTRTLVTLPDRITEGLCRVLEGYHRVPIWVNTHFNHPKEITEASARAVHRLTQCGIAVNNQSVLLRGINDDVPTFRKLCQRLLAIRVRPYYLFYCEPAPGLDHFRTPVEKGAELIRDAIRGHTTGMAQPMYVVATNIGKIPISRDYYMVEENEAEYVFRNYKGEQTTLPNIRYPNRKGF